jgi:hypothetical protein
VTSSRLIGIALVLISATIFSSVGFFVKGVKAAVVGASGTITFIPSFKFTTIANVSLIWAAAPNGAKLSTFSMCQHGVRLLPPLG